MLAANIAVAMALDDRGWLLCGVGMASPILSKLRLLAQFAKILGYPLKKCESRHDLQNLLRRVSGSRTSGPSISPCCGV